MYGRFVFYVDAKAAFLKGDMDLDVFVQLDLNFSQNMKKQIVFKLSQFQFGLLHAPLIWFLKPKEVLLNKHASFNFNDTPLYFEAHENQNCYFLGFLWRSALPIKLFWPIEKGNKKL